MAKVNILLADDHKIVREGIRSLLEDEIGFNIAAEANNGKEAVEACEENDIDLVVMDISMPEMDGIEATEAIRSQFPDVKVLALTMMDEDEHIRNMIEAGASGYILKNSDRNEFIDALTTILDGKHYFSEDATHRIMMDLVKGKERKDSGVDQITDREKEVLELIVREHTNQEIADKLNISIRTVGAHRMHLLQKTGSKNTAGLVTYALRNNLVDFE